MHLRFVSHRSVGHLTIELQRHFRNAETARTRPGRIIYLVGKRDLEQHEQAVALPAVRRHYSTQACRQGNGHGGEVRTGFGAPQRLGKAWRQVYPLQRFLVNVLYLLSQPIPYSLLVMWDANFRRIEDPGFQEPGKSRWAGSRISPLSLSPFLSSCNSPALCLISTHSIL